MANRYKMVQRTPVCHVFCDVTDCETPAKLLQSLSTALELKQLKTTPLDTIVRKLNLDHISVPEAVQGSFLIMDNCEHLSSDTCAMLNTIATRCPDIRILTTTQRELDTDLSFVYQLQSMSLLNSIELFIEHCQKHLPSWKLDRNNGDSVLQLVNFLDRNPLAIELAGARIALVPLQTLIKQMKTQSGTFQPDKHTQRTLHQTLEWSFQFYRRQTCLSFSSPVVYQNDLQWNLQKVSSLQTVFIPSPICLIFSPIAISFTKSFRINGRHLKC